MFGVNITKVLGNFIQYSDLFPNQVSVQVENASVLQPENIPICQGEPKEIKGIFRGEEGYGCNVIAREDQDSSFLEVSGFVIFISCDGSNNLHGENQACNTLIGEGFGARK